MRLVPVRVSVLLVAALLVVACAPSTSASSARVCTPPKVEGFVITSLKSRGIACATVRQLVQAAIYYGQVRGYTCKLVRRGKYTDITCRVRAKPQRLFESTFAKA